MASDGASPGFAPGCTTGGAGRSMSCTFHLLPGMTGVSEYPMGEGLSASAAMAKATMSKGGRTRSRVFMGYSENDREPRAWQVRASRGRPKTRHAYHRWH